MMGTRNTQKTSPNSRKGFRAIDYIGHFFNPVSREDLQACITRSDNASINTAATLASTKILQEQIEQHLSAK